MLRRVADVAGIDGQQVEGDERGGRSPREHGHARGGRVQAQLETFEVEALVSGDHDFAVQDAVIGKSRQQRFVKFREVAVERP